MRVLKLKNRNVQEKLKSVLEKGNIAAIPTDTVYGLATKADSKAIKKLAALKGKSLPFASLVSSPAQIRKLAKIKNLTQKRVIKNLLPNKLTLVLEEKRKQQFSFKGKVGVRIPAADWLLKFLTYYEKPLVATSANTHNDPPLRSAREIMENFPQLDLIVDGGEINGRSSTVVDLSSYPPVIRRLGPVSIFTIEKVIKRKIQLAKDAYFSILVVCTGNACRSPMAVGILRKLLKGLPIFVYSAGTFSDLGLAAAKNAIVTAGEFGADISNHQSQPLSRELIIRSDLILVMQHRHRDKVLNLVPDAHSKVFLVKGFPTGSGEIFDPVGGTIDVYKRCMKLMLPDLKKVAKEVERRYG